MRLHCRIPLYALLCAAFAVWSAQSDILLPDGVGSLPLVASITNGMVQATVSVNTDGSLKEVYAAHTAASSHTSSFTPVLQYSGPSVVTASSTGENASPQVTWVSVTSPDAKTILVTGYMGSVSVGRKIVLPSVCECGYNTIVEISHSASVPPGPDSPIALVSYEDFYTTLYSDPDFIHSQNIKRQDGDFISHWQFKSPAIILQKGPIMTSLLADARKFSKQMFQAYPLAMDLFNVEGAPANFSYGIADSVLTYHSIYGRSGKVLNWTAEADISLYYMLQISGTEPPLQGYRQVVRALWSFFGSPTLSAAPDSQTNAGNTSLHLFEDFQNDCWYVWAQQLYLEFQCGNERCSSLQSWRMWSNPPLQLTNNDGWFNSWFQNMRTSLGMYSFGQRSNDSRIMQQGNLWADRSRWRDVCVIILSS